MNTNARQQALIAAQQARTAGQLYAANREAEQRVAPVTGVVSGYDSTTGDYLIATPDGGTIRTQSLTDGALVGLRLPVQRFGDSQTSAVSAPPSRSDSAGSATTVETATRDVVSLLGVETIDIRIDSPADESYTIAPYQHYAVRVDAVEGVSGGTITTTPAIGSIAAIGDPISIAIAGSDPSTPFLASILLRRIG